MAALLSLGRASYRYDGAPAPTIDALTLAISRGDRIAITGPNGCGKSTLLRLLAGDLAPTEGEVARRHGLAVATVRQELTGEQLAGMSALDLVGGPDARRLLGRLGVPRDRRDVPLGELSGGQRSRVQLAAVLASAAGSVDLVLLDEPTNHLDADACDQLDRLVAGLDAAVVFATHDRRLLEAAATSVLAFDGRGGVRFDRGSTWAEHLERASAAERRAWADWRAGERRAAAAERAADLRMRTASAMLVDPATGKGTTHFHYRKRAAKVERTAKVIRRREEVARRTGPQRPWTEAPRPSLAAGRVSRSGIDAVTVCDAAIGWQACSPVLAQVDLHVARGERVLLAGPNGSGKTTLLCALEGLIAPSAGAIELGTGVAVASVAQVLDGAFDEQRPVDLCLAAMQAPDRTTRVLGLLAALRVRERLLQTTIGQLSEGTRRKVALARLLLDEGNLLLLDEPTNHLDLPTRIALEELLTGFQGTVVFATHDRAFAERVATRTIDVRAWQAP